MSDGFGGGGYRLPQDETADGLPQDFDWGAQGSNDQEQNAVASLYTQQASNDPEK